MAHKSVQTGDNWFSTPGTCNQTGNRAPKFPWSHSPVGRFARIAALCCAYRLGYDDDRMAKLHQFPSAEDLLALFLRLVPWFPAHYDAVREAKAASTNYTGPLEQFNAMDLENRVRYCFAVPGRRGHDQKSRLYGISVEHPSSTAQRKPGGRGEVFSRSSVEVMRRLELNLTVSYEEAEAWGR